MPSCRRIEEVEVLTHRFHCFFRVGGEDTAHGVSAQLFAITIRPSPLPAVTSGCWVPWTGRDSKRSGRRSRLESLVGVESRRYSGYELRHPISQRDILWFVVPVGESACLCPARAESRNASNSILTNNLRANMPFILRMFNLSTE